MVFGFGNRNAGLEELREKMDQEVSFWKKQLDKCVHEKDYWLAMAYAAQRQVRVLEAHHRMQQDQQQQLCNQLENAQKRLEQCTCSLVTSRVMVPPPDPVCSPPRDAAAAESDTIKKLKLKLLSVEAQLKKSDLLAKRGEDRSDSLGQEVSRLRSELECARSTLAAHAHEADQLRRQLVAARGLGDDTAGQAAWLAIELQKAQATVQQLRAELSNKDEMLGLLRLQLSDYVAAVGGSQCASGTTTPTMMRESLAGAVNARLLSLLTPRSPLASNGGNQTPRSSVTPPALTPRCSEQNSIRPMFHRSNTEPNLLSEDELGDIRTSSSTHQRPPGLEFTFLHDHSPTGAFIAVRETPSTPNVALPASGDTLGQQQAIGRRPSQLQPLNLVASHQLVMTASEAQGQLTTRSFEITEPIGNLTARSFEISEPITQADFAPYLPCPPTKLLSSQPLRSSSSETESDGMPGTSGSGHETAQTTIGPATASGSTCSRPGSPEPVDMGEGPTTADDTMHLQAATQHGKLVARSSSDSAAPHDVLTTESDGGDDGGQSNGGRRLLTPQITLAAGCRDLADVLVQSLTADSATSQEPVAASISSPGTSVGHTAAHEGQSCGLDIVSLGVKSLSDGGPHRSRDVHQQLAPHPAGDSCYEQETTHLQGQQQQDATSAQHEIAVVEQGSSDAIGDVVSGVTTHVLANSKEPSHGEAGCELACMPQDDQHGNGLAAAPDAPEMLAASQPVDSTTHAQADLLMEAGHAARVPASVDMQPSEETEFSVANIRARFAAFEVTGEHKPLTPVAVGSHSLRCKPQVHPCARTGMSGITHRLGSFRERTEQ